MKTLLINFDNREQLIEYVKYLSPWAVGNASEIQGGNDAAQIALEKIDPINYGKTRNFGDGKVTKLSPYIHHGIISLNDVRNHALEKCFQPEQITKFIQELAWRDFWQRFANKYPEWLWNDIENYKTGFHASEYVDELPHDIVQGSTGVACINSFINDLVTTGYIHNHARMYLASYMVHFRRIKWQAGARWFLQHLLDGDEASNNLSWQWVASTFSNKPYIFNLANVHKYFGSLVNTSSGSNEVLNANYEELSERLFPKKKKLDNG